MKYSEAKYKHAYNVSLSSLRRLKLSAEDCEDFTQTAILRTLNKNCDNLTVYTVVSAVNYAKNNFRNKLVEQKHNENWHIDLELEKTFKKMQEEHDEERKTLFNKILKQYKAQKPRQKQRIKVIKLFLKTNSTREVGKKMGLAQDTVRAHIRSFTIEAKDLV